MQGANSYKIQHLLKKYHTWQRSKKDIELPGCEGGIHMLKFLFRNYTENPTNATVGSSW